MKKIVEKMFAWTKIRPTQTATVGPIPLSFWNPWLNKRFLPRNLPDIAKITIPGKLHSMHRQTSTLRHLQIPLQIYNLNLPSRGRALIFQATTRKRHVTPDVYYYAPAT
jgi:hypothetical protein